MQVFKFGGASVKDADAVRNVGNIIRDYGKGPLLVIISAMGKTTNALEDLVNAYLQNQSDISDRFEAIKAFHQNIIRDLLPSAGSHAYDEIDNLFIELGCLLEGQPDENADLLYDQVVSFGELISTRIVSTYLNETGLSNRWMDARNFIHTSDHYKEGRVQWDTTTNRIQKTLKPLVQKQLIISQGFIGKAPDGTTTTLGREGSDYSAAIFAYALQADSLTIWKDVAGVMNADPKRLPEATKLDLLSYREATELAYYGATVIHPKTIQPLEDQKIPLLVKSFINPLADGTQVRSDAPDVQVPLFIFKANQVMISLETRDFSFILEEHLANLFVRLAEQGVKVNLMQNAATSFSFCFNAGNEAQIAALLSDVFEARIAGYGELITIRHGNDAVAASLKGQRKALMQQESGATLQMLLAN